VPAPGGHRHGLRGADGRAHHQEDGPTVGSRLRLQQVYFSLFPGVYFFNEFFIIVFKIIMFLLFFLFLYYFIYHFFH
jgi:hypothetical protein